MTNQRPISKLLVIQGSPRRQGNTDLLAEMAVKQVLQSAANPPEIQSIRAAQVKARPCLACGACAPTGECVVQDGMQAVYEAVRWADTIIIACPVYFASVTAQLKTVIDRFQCAWSAKYLLHEPWIKPDEDRRALLLSTGGMQVSRHMSQVRDVVRSWLIVLNYRYASELLLPGVDDRAAVLAVPEIEARVAQATQALRDDQSASGKLR